MANPNEKRNFAIHSLEGGLYMGGIAFLSAESVLPTMVNSRGGSEWLVALMPSLMAMGFFTPVLFVVPLRIPTFLRSRHGPIDTPLSAPPRPGPGAAIQQRRSERTLNPQSISATPALLLHLDTEGSDHFHDFRRRFRISRSHILIPPCQSRPGPCYHHFATNLTITSARAVMFKPLQISRASSSSRATPTWSSPGVSPGSAPRRDAPRWAVTTSASKKRLFICEWDWTPRR